MKRTPVTCDWFHTGFDSQLFNRRGIRQGMIDETRGWFRFMSHSGFAVGTSPLEFTRTVAEGVGFEPMAAELCTSSMTVIPVLKASAHMSKSRLKFRSRSILVLKSVVSRVVSRDTFFEVNWGEVVERTTPSRTSDYPIFTDIKS